MNQQGGRGCREGRRSETKGDAHGLSLRVERDLEQKKVEGHDELIKERMETREEI